MRHPWDRCRTRRMATYWTTAGRVTARVAGTAALAWLGASPLHAQPLHLQQLRVQQSAASGGPLVFDHVTVVDVEQGQLLSDQRVVIAGHRIQALGRPSQVPLPPAAQVVDAQGKYLIPGLWDMHAHTWTKAFIARGITGIRQPGQMGSIASMREEREKILAGEVIGPRTIFAGQFINTWPDEGDMIYGSTLNYMAALGLLESGEVASLDSIAGTLGGWHDPRALDILDSVVISSGRIDSVVKRYKTEGADFIKLRDMSSARMYFAFAAAARRWGLPFGGHAEEESPIAASDSGATVIDHVPSPRNYEGPDALGASCLAKQTASVERCRPIAEHFRRNGTWWVPTLVISTDVFPGWWRCKYDYAAGGVPVSCPADSVGMLTIPRRVGMPIMAGTDDFSTIHAELAVFVAEGLTPLEALQTATLNPAKYLHGTDSLGTVAAGKLADLVLLDANPLADITNTTKIHAVVANGRYFDRAALDALLAGTNAGTNARP